jgi:hypothetical protein
VGAALGGALVNAGLASTALGGALDVVGGLPELVQATAKLASISKLTVRTIL